LAHTRSVDAKEMAASETVPRDESLPARAIALGSQLRKLPPRLLALGLGMAVLVWAYWPNLRQLYTVWMDEPNYSHGLLVIPIALVILWQRLPDSPIDWNTSIVPRWSLLPLAAVLATRIVAYERNYQWLETATLVPAVACLVLAIGGWTLWKCAWPAVVFLVFMLPLPISTNTAIALPLQHAAAVGSVFLMQLTGLWAIAEGNVIVLRDHANATKILEVAQACNGLSMLMTLAATVTATIMLVPLANWKRVVVLASAIPIALLSNIVRIVGTGWCYYYIDQERAKKLAHDWTGLVLMMPLAMILVGLELLLLSWLADDRHPPPEAADRPILPGFHQRPGDKIKPKTASDDI
jgi:exosortase